MAFPPPGPFGHNFGTMPPFIHLNANAAAAGHQYAAGIHHPASIPMPGLPPMSGLVPSALALSGYPPNLIPVPAAASGMITVPAGSVTAAAPPVRNFTEFTSGFRPNVNPVPPPHQPPQQQQQQQTPEIQNEKKKPSGPSITVFVGSISDRASDTLVRLLLTKCGYVNVWKRVQGANGKLQGFGFCDFGDPESAMTAIRILNDLEIGDKKLVVKADENAKRELQDYVKLKNPNASTDDDVDDETKKQDEKLKQEIMNLLREHKAELTKEKDDSKSASRKASSNRGNGDTKGENLDDMEMEEEKRSLINREIDKFRDTYKVS